MKKKENEREINVFKSKHTGKSQKRGINRILYNKKNFNKKQKNVTK